MWNKFKNFLKSNIDAIKNILNYLFNHWRRFLAVVLIFIPLLFSIKLFDVNEVIPKENEQIILIWGITIQNWGAWLAIVGIPFTAAWGMFQYDKKRAIEQQNKAYEVAAIFSEELLEDINIIGEVLERYEPIEKLYEDIKFEELKRFDIYEINSMCKDGRRKLKKFDRLLRSPELDNAYKEFIRTNCPEKNNDERYKRKFAHFVTDTINWLECVSINIASNAAGVDYLYPSLHQVLLPFIQKMSLFISSANGNYTYKYFINIIEVYNNWMIIREKEENKELKVQNKIQKLKNKYEKKVRKYQNKLDSEVNKALEKKPRKI